MTPTIQVDEWLSELRRIEAESIRVNDVAGFSTDDVQRAIGLEDRTIRRRMREWFRAGLIELAGKRPGFAMDGRRTWTPVYRMVEREQKIAASKPRRRA